MAYVPIAGQVLQLAKNAAGAAAGGYYLKFYQSGTSTPLSMGVDSTPSSTLAKCALNSRGEPISDAGNEDSWFVPHLNQAYKIVLYPTSTDADNDTTANALWLLDGVSNVFDASNINYTSSVTIKQYLDNLCVASYTALRALTSSQLVDGDIITVTNSDIAGDFVIKTGTVTDNGGTLIVFADDSNRYAERVYSGEVNVTWFGAVGDGTTDDTAAIQAAIDSITYGTVFLPYTSNSYAIASSLTLPVGINLLGDGSVTTIKVLSSGTYTNNFCLLWNTTNGSDWILSYPNFLMGNISNIFFDAEDTTLEGIVFSGSAHIKNVFVRGFKRSFVGSAQYNDQVRLDRVYIFSTNNAEYQVDLLNTGDCVVIDQLHTPNISNSPLTPMNSVRVSNNGCKITNSLLGNVRFINCNGLCSVENSGMDGGKFYIDKSIVNISNCSLSAHPTGAVFEMINDGGSSYKLQLENISISHDVLRDEYDPYEYDIKTANNFQVEIRNVNRNIIYNTAPESKQMHGVKIETEAGASLSSFNNLSHFYSSKCLISDERIIDGDIDISIPNTSLFYLGAASTTTILDWDEASATYYYKAQVLWEPSRLIGRSDLNAERSIAVTNGGNGVALAIGTSSYTRPCIVRLYRGTSTGSYNAYVDIPVISSGVLWDKGTYISGHAWISRTAGAVDTINSFAISGFSLRMGLVDMIATAAASAGSWVEGDKIRNSSMSVDANNMVLEGWNRITTGTGHSLGTDWARRYISDVSPAT